MVKIGYRFTKIVLRFVARQTSRNGETRALPILGDNVAQSYSNALNVVRLVISCCNTSAAQGYDTAHRHVNKSPMRRTKMRGRGATILSTPPTGGGWILLLVLMVATRLHEGKICSAFVAPIFPITSYDHSGFTAVSRQSAAAITINRRPTISSSTSPPPRRNVQSPSCRLQAEKQSETEYIDDCFGLIFLSGSFVAQDTIFSATFVALSAIALVATRANQIQLPPEVSKERQRRAVPAVVAAATLLLTPVLEILLAPVFTQELDEKARLIELAVCVVSVVYGFVAKVDDE